MADNKRGRKSKYETDVLPHIEEIKKAKHGIKGLWELLKTLNPTVSTDIETRVINIFQSKNP